MKKIYLLLIAIFFLLPFLIHAETSLSISPEKIDLELEPGQILKDKIRIANLGKTSLIININLKNFVAAGEKGGIKFKEGEGDISSDPTHWIKLDSHSFILKPGQTKDVNFSLEIPPNAEPGGYYLAVLFQPVIFSKEKISTAVIPTLGALFLLKIKGDEEKFPSLENQFELVELNIPRFIEIGPIPINFRVKNNDPVHIKVGGKLIIYNFFGKIKEEIKINEQTILPQKIRLFEIKTSEKKFFDKIFLGPYQVKLILSTPTWREKIGNDQQLVKKFKFYGFPWKFFLLILFPILIPLLIKLFKKLHL